MNKPNIYQHKPLQERQGAPQALTSSASDGQHDRTATGDAVRRTAKRNAACRSGNTGGSTRPNVGIHTVFVLNKNGRHLTPTTPAKARRLLAGNQATKIWSKFNTFGIQLKEKTRAETPKTTLGIDNGSKFEGYSVVTGKENNLSIKLNLPDKKKIVRKIKERREARRTRRSRLRRRKPRFDNRKKANWIAPSQLVLLQSRLKVIRELYRIYPIQEVAIEDVRFNHKKHRWGANFSTVEIGKNRLRQWFDLNNIKRHEFKGHQTKKLREKYGYQKTPDKSADKFEAHCSDSLALAVEVNQRERISPGPFLTVDDTYRCVRRRIHDSNLKPGGLREKYSKGTVFSLKKGMMIGTKRGEVGRLCGETNGNYFFRDVSGKRRCTSKITWINNQWRRAFLPDAKDVGVSCPQVG